MAGSLAEVALLGRMSRWRSCRSSNTRRCKGLGSVRSRTSGCSDSPGTWKRTRLRCSVPSSPSRPRKSHRVSPSAVCRVRRQLLPQVPFQVVGQQAHQRVRPHAVRIPHVERAPRARAASARPRAAGWSGAWRPGRSPPGPPRWPAAGPRGAGPARAAAGGDRVARGVAQQADEDLAAAALAVAGVAAADAEGLLAEAIDLAAAEHGADDIDVVRHGARPITWKQYRTHLYCVSSINKDYDALRTWQQISSLQSGLWSGKPRYSNDLVDGARA